MDNELHVASGSGALRHVGQLLRHWRTARGITQLALALQAEISARHLSYVEAGRAAPSREMPGVPNGPRMIFHPQGLRPYVQNWEEVAARMILRFHREAAANPADMQTRALLEELLGYPDVPSRWRTPDFDAPPAPTFSVCYRKGEQIFRFFSVLATFGSPQDVTLQELRIESFFPSDEQTRIALLRLAER